MRYNLLFKKSSILLYVYIIGVLFSCNSTEKYKDIDLSFEERVDDLVSKMTLEEKISQLVFNAPAIERFQIPAYNWWNECLHGVGRAGIATVFPQPIGMAAMWDDSIVYEIATVVSDEARAKYHDFVKKGKRGIYHGLTYWSPNINLFRDPRWGRGMETYGEDPYLTGQLGVAFVKGLQGNDPKYLKLVATAKHFIVHSGPEGKRHNFNATPSQYDFLETYSPHFKKVVQEGNVYSVMCAYNKYHGTPCCGNMGLSDLLRNKWDFKGYVVSDCWAITDFYNQNAHEIVNTKAEAASIAVKSGTDLNCGDSYHALVEAVEKGYVAEKEIDVAVKRLFLARMKLGMFDPDEKVPYASIPFSVVDCKKHQKLALDAAHKSIVLLKNEDNILPISKKIKSVAVIGPNANELNVLFGNYYGYPSSPITPYSGIKEKLPHADVKYAQGCKLAEELPFLTPIPEDVFYVDSTKTKNGLKAEYYNNTKFSGKPAKEIIDENIDFKWWKNTPAGILNKDTFCVRWNGYLVPKVSGKYAIGIEGYPKINFTLDKAGSKTYFSEHHSQRIYEFVQLEAGKTYSVKYEYIQNQADYPYTQLLWEEPGKDLKSEAIQLASKSDVVVLCMGLSPLLEGEEMSVKVKGFSGGDRINIDLPEVQTDLIKSVYQLGKPTVLVLLNGSALAFNWESENLKAIIEAWYPGQSGGEAIADVIFGDYNPSGKLPVTFYKSVDQLPDFEDYNMDGRTYKYFKGEPLYEFGYGLSYSKFKFGNLIFPKTVLAGEHLEVSVDVTNIGALDGEEVVQLYISHPDSKYRVPIRALKGFKRVFLKSGESGTVRFVIEPQDMAVLDSRDKYIIENCQILINIGGKQPDKNAYEQGIVVGGIVNVNVKKGKYYMLDGNKN